MLKEKFSTQTKNSQHKRKTLVKGKVKKDKDNFTQEKNK